jgi:hypothetical protein
MSRPFSLLMLMAVAGVSLTAPIAAQTRSAVSVAELDAAVAERPAAAREAVLKFLTTDRAQEAADRMGVNISDLSARVAGLDQASLTQVAHQAGMTDEVLAGGADSRIVISATTLIIILLVVILIAR